LGLHLIELIIAYSMIYESKKEVLMPP